MQTDYPRVLKDTPCFAAITLFAPGERFNATPAFALAIVFNVRTSCFNARDELLFSSSFRFVFENRACITARTFSNARRSSVI